MGFLKNLFGGQPKPGKPKSVTDATFEQEVLDNHRPSAVDFWSPTCAPCQVMSGLLEEIGPGYADKVDIFKLNVSQNPRTAQIYQIRGVPTVVLIRKGREVDRIVGLMPLNPLKEKLDNLARKKG